MGGRRGGDFIEFQGSEGRLRGSGLRLLIACCGFLSWLRCNEMGERSRDEYERF